MGSNVQDQLSKFAFFDAAAKRQASFLRIFGIIMLMLAIGFPIASLFTGIPFWVSGIMFVCGSFLGGMSMWIGVRGGSSRVLTYLRANNDPIVSAKIWGEVRGGFRTVFFELATQSGQSITETFDTSRAMKVAYDEEAQAIDAIRSVVPRVEVLAYTDQGWVIDQARSQGLG